MKPDAVLDDLIAGLRCREVLAALGDYSDGTLTADRRAAIEAHVGACPNCAAFGGAYGALVTALRARLTTDDLDPDLAARLQARLADDAEQP